MLLNRQVIDLINKIPKAQLHIHIQGTLQPKLMFKLAERNKIKMAYKSEAEVCAAYKFSNLQEFLDIYYAGCEVLVEEQDFFELAWEYFLKCQQNSIRHTQIFFDPQTHTGRNISFETLIKGLRRAQLKAQQQLKISSYLIMSFLRHLDQESAFRTLEQALPFKKQIIGVGLDSSQVGNPPQKFARVFKRAKDEGFRLVAHAGEQGPASYIWDAINILNVERIDHGVRCQEDQQLIKYLIQTQIPLTCCPLSNCHTNVFPKMSQNNYKILLNKGINATINSDDPAYFNGYLSQNYLQAHQHLKLSIEQIKKAAINSFKGSFLPKHIIQVYIQQIMNIQ